MTEMAELGTDELLVAVARQCKALLHESEAEAARITEDARRRARELLKAAELEAQGIVGAASRERALLENELEEKRSALEEVQTKLSSIASTEEAEHEAQELLAAA